MGNFENNALKINPKNKLDIEPIKGSAEGYFNHILQHFLLSFIFNYSVLFLSSPALTAIAITSIPILLFVILYKLFI